MYQSCTPKMLFHDAKSKVLSKPFKNFTLLPHAVYCYLTESWVCKSIVDVLLDKYE